MSVSTDYKVAVLQQIENRNKLYGRFADIINSHNLLHDQNKNLQKENENLKNELEKNRREISTKAHGTVTGSERSEQVAALEQKLIRIQEELTEVHRTKGARNQQIIDLNFAVQEKEKELIEVKQTLKDKTDEVNKLNQQTSSLETHISELQQANQTLKDEYQALHITYESVDGKLRQCQMDNRDLVERWLKFKHKEAESLNSENDNFKRKSDRKVTAGLQEGAVENTQQARSTHNIYTTIDTSVHPFITTGKVQMLLPQAMISIQLPRLRLNKSKSNILVSKKVSIEEETPPSMYGSHHHCMAVVRLPQLALCKWRAHESEVTATRFSSSGGILATGGSDRFIHIWNFIGGTDKSRLQYTLRGSNGGITDIDMGPQDQILAASSNDYATRIWTIETQRLKLTLTGHGGKVLAARFLGSVHRLASGSNDRTVKVWDVRSGSCTRTFMAGSSCNDLVSADDADCLASGHFDRKVRIWDARISGHAQNEIVVGGRVTSVDMPFDKTTLVCCTKDHTLEVIDLRKSAVVSLFSDDRFKVATDQTRCSYSNDGMFVAVGSSDGSVLTWKVKTGELVSITKEHRAIQLFHAIGWKNSILFIIITKSNFNCVLWVRY
uniref:Autophagy-related protein 16-1 n=1 Tax=Ciona intestinalis TaxID=7719 RepID=F6ZTE1_CIOIN